MVFGSRAWREKISASSIGKPFISYKKSPTLVFPVAIPPVMPIRRWELFQNVRELGLSNLSIMIQDKLCV